MTDSPPEYPAGPDPAQRPRARRYADALAAAAGADQRVTELTERLQDAEWHREHAEHTADALLTRLDLGDQQVINSLDDPPGPDVDALLSLATGKVWVRSTNHYLDADKAKYWLRGESSQRGAMNYEWPLDDGGPFIAIPDGWHLRSQTTIARRRDEAEDALRDLLRHEPGYTSGSIGYGLPGIVDLVKGVLAAHRERWLVIARERDDARQRLHDVRRLLAGPLPPIERHDAILAILDRPAPGEKPAAPTVPRCSVCGHQLHSEGACLNMASDNDCDCRADELGGPVYDGNSDRLL